MFFPIWILIVLIYYLGLRNLQEQVKKAFCYQKLFWSFTVWINCSSDLKIFASSQPSASNYKSYSLTLKQFFSHSQNNFGNKIPFFSHQSCPCVLRFTKVFFCKYLYLVLNYCIPYHTYQGRRGSQGLVLA